MTERIEYRTHYTYPYLENAGLTKYGPPGATVVQADHRAEDADEAYWTAGKTLGHQKRTVIETEWEDVTE